MLHKHYEIERWVKTLKEERDYLEAEFEKLQMCIRDSWCSVHTVLDEKRFWEIIGKLKGLGAEGILVLPIEKMIV